MSMAIVHNMSRFVVALLFFASLCAAEDLKWWQTGVIYQIYPRSFKDANNDGIGDLPGVTSKLGYLKELGVAGFWLSPMYPSPQVDFGYDISNFTDVDPIYGSLGDFDELVKESKRLGLRVIMDLVPNHSSDQHPWFQKSIRKEPGFEDFYVWRDPKGFKADGTPIPPNNWVSYFYGSAWEYNTERKQFYLHQFAVGQPDLNYRNPKVVEAMNDVLTFWLNRGVDGFRVDAIWTLFEAAEELDEPVANNGITDPNAFEYLDHIYTKDQPETYEVVRGWRKLIDEFSKDGIDRVMFVEMSGSTELTMAFFGTPEEPSAHFPFNFKLILVRNTTSASEFKRLIDEWVDNVPEWGWSNWVVGNHDQNRIGSRLGAELIDATNMLVMTLPGTAITYNGEEIGMVDNYEITFEEGVDPQGKNNPPELWLTKSRDFQRTPFQWNSSVNAGFNDGATPWLPVHENYKEVNELVEESDPKSHLNIYKKLLSDIRPLKVWQLGNTSTFVLNENVLMIKRNLNDQTLVTLVNFGNSPEGVNVSQHLEGKAKENLKVLLADKNSGLETDAVVPAGSVIIGQYGGLVLGAL